MLKWQGYSDADNTWEDAENLYCPELLEDFERRWIQEQLNASSSAKTESSSVQKRRRGSGPREDSSSNEDAPSTSRSAGKVSARRAATGNGGKTLRRLAETTSIDLTQLNVMSSATPPRKAPTNGKVSPVMSPTGSRAAVNLFSPTRADSVTQTAPLSTESKSTVSRTTQTPGTNDWESAVEKILGMDRDANGQLKVRLKWCVVPFNLVSF